MPRKTGLDKVFVVYDNSGDFHEIYTDQSEAIQMSEVRQALGYGPVGIKEAEVHWPETDKGDANGTPTLTAKPKKSKKTVERSSTAEGSDELTLLAADGSTETPKAKKPRAKKSDAATTAPKDIPDALDNSLAGLKLIFIGTISMNHPTACATATKYGATIAKKIEDADYVILGKNPSTKQTESISSSGVESISADRFVEMIQNGAPYDKLQHILSETVAAEPPKKKQKKA